MLSYQHEFHAGNHADVLKHTCLLELLSSLTQKEKPFTVIDSHAGAGTYSLEDERLLKTGEHLTGICLLREQCEGQTVPAAVMRYLQAESPYADRKLYAGSPTLTRLFLREGDAHFAVELHPQALEELERSCAEPVVTATGKRQCPARTHIQKQDSYKALSALTPPLIRRGLVLIDPSYEDTSDYRQVAEAAANVRRKWNTATVAVWYPLLLRRRHETAQMLSALETAAKTGTMPCGIARTELCVGSESETLYGSGMIVINPPWKYGEEADEAARFLAQVLRTVTR